MKRLNRNKILKRIAFAIAILLVIPQLTSSCLQFRMTPDEVDSYFPNGGKPVLQEVQVEDRTINYAYQDNHKPVTAVFLHGAPGSWSAFVDFMKDDELRSKANVLSIDRPGYGYSDFGDPVVSLADQSHMIAEVLQKFQSDQLILIGHSLGGPVAARIAMDFPELVKGLVLVAPSIDPEQEKNEWYRYLGKNKLAKWILPKSLYVTNEEIYDLKQELINMLPYWQNIKVPVIVIQGTDDKLVPKENADFAARMIPKKYIDLWMLEGVNHFIPWNNHDVITEAILSETDILASRGGGIRNLSAQ